MPWAEQEGQAQARRQKQQLLEKKAFHDVMEEEIQAGAFRITDRVSHRFHGGLGWFAFVRIVFTLKSQDFKIYQLELKMYNFFPIVYLSPELVQYC